MGVFSSAPRLARSKISRSRTLAYSRRGLRDEQARRRSRDEAARCGHPPASGPWGKRSTYYTTVPAWRRVRTRCASNEFGHVVVKDSFGLSQRSSST
eukprot:COSAG05_NODE_7369_length_821_cov_1.150970_1_plen_96_part_01